MNEDHDCACCQKAPGVYLRSMGRIGLNDAGRIQLQTLVDLVCADCLPPPAGRGHRWEAK